MLNIQGVAAGHGYVRSAFSRRMAAQVIALDLVRTSLKIVLASQRAAVRARVSAAFSCYLVSDESPSDLCEAEMRAMVCCEQMESGPAFVVRRSFYAEQAAFTITGRKGAWHGRGDEMQGWVGDSDNSLDAPEWLPGGAARRMGYGRVGWFVGAVIVSRGGWK